MSSVRERKEASLSNQPPRVPLNKRAHLQKLRRYMARLYSGKRGSSGSTRPVSRRPPSWFKYEPEEVEALVVKLGKEGNSPSIIGQILRDRYGIPLVSQISQRRLERLLPPELKPKVPEDLENLLKKANSTRRHLEKNRKDYP